MIISSIAFLKDQTELFHATKQKQNSRTWAGMNINNEKLCVLFSAFFCFWSLTVDLMKKRKQSLRKFQKNKIHWKFIFSFSFKNIYNSKWKKGLWTLFPLYLAKALKNQSNKKENQLIPKLKWSTFQWNLLMTIASLHNSNYLRIHEKKIFFLNSFIWLVWLFVSQLLLRFSSVICLMKLNRINS
jgi:hypothetical protein